MVQIIIALLAALQLTALTVISPVTNWLVDQASYHVSQLQPGVTGYKTLGTPAGSAPKLNLSASGAIAIDAGTGQVLYAKNAAKALPIASITKVFTVLVMLRDHSLDETVTVPVLPAYPAGAVVLGAPAGSKFKLSELVKAALIPSDNDAADSLAIHDSGSVKAFTAKMNALVADWKITGLHFSSASGLEDNDNYASPAALAAAARLLLSNQAAASITSSQTATISDQSGHTYNLATTNELLKKPGFTGIKTGYTPAAGQCVIARATINGHQVITVILGSQDRFGETEQLVNAIKEAYSWQ